LLLGGGAKPSWRPAQVTERSFTPGKSTGTANATFT
jgi:hypothetical protein